MCFPLLNIDKQIRKRQTFLLKRESTIIKITTMVLKIQRYKDCKQKSHFNTQVSLYADAEDSIFILSKVTQFWIF